MQPDFETMTEADVREIIVRPLLTRLRYAHGTQANVRTEVTLRYDRAFLGRKQPKKDPPLVGRADYICDAISYARWTVEVKVPSHELTQDDVEQAHTYSAHPEIGALYFMVTNGREFRLYATGQLSEPVLAWRYEAIDSILLNLFNTLGYEALKKRVGLIRPDPGKPLGQNLPSRLLIRGGEVLYGEHKSDHPLFQGDVLNGQAGAVTGISVEREESGRLHAKVSMISPFPQLAQLNKLAGLEDFDFYSADEHISTDPDLPTVFQNVQIGRVEPGARFKLFPAMPEMALPIGFAFSVFTQATGCVEGDTFRGALAFEYDYQVIRGPPSPIPQVQAMVASAPASAKVIGAGEFRLVVSHAI